MSSVRRLGAFVVAVVAVLAITAARRVRPAQRGNQISPIRRPCSMPPLPRFCSSSMNRFGVSLGGISLLDQKGAPVSIGPAEHVNGDPSRIRASVPQIGQRYHDGRLAGHLRRLRIPSGTFSFVVVTGDQVDINAVAQRASEPMTAGCRCCWSAARFAGFVGLAGLIGGLAFLVIVWPAGAGAPGGAPLGVVPAGSCSWWRASLLRPRRPVRRGRNLRITCSIQSLWRASRLAPFRTWMLVRLTVALIAGALVATVRASRHLAWRLAATAMAGVVAFTYSMTGHAGTGRIAGLGVVLDMTHVLSMSVWLGGLVLLVVGLLLTREKPPLVARFSALALGCVVLLVSTGVAQSLPNATVDRHHLLLRLGPRLQHQALRRDHPHRRRLCEPAYRPPLLA